MVAILEQLFSELRTGETGWKRATLLDKLQLDIFLRLWKREKPDFASFFLNSTAHFQHAYFHLLEPEQFTLRLRTWTTSCTATRSCSDTRRWTGCSAK